jgi:hypothetical protein
LQHKFTHWRPGREPLAPREQVWGGAVHGRAESGGKQLRHVEGNVGIAVVAGKIIVFCQQRLHLGVKRPNLRDRFLSERLRELLLQAHQQDHLRKEYLIGFMLEQSGVGAPRGRVRPQRRLWFQVFEILEDLSRVEDLNALVYEYRHLALGVDLQHLRMLGLVAMIVRKGHHNDVDRQALLQGRDMHLGAEHAQGSGVQDQHGLTETTGNVVFGELLLRIGEYQIRRADFYEIAHVKIGRALRHPGCLLHVVRHDDYRIVAAQLID